MQNETNREWFLPARLKVQRLASEAESARVFGLEVQAETHSHVAKIRELNERVEKLTDERAYFARMVGANTSNDISRILSSRAEKSTFTNKPWPMPASALQRCSTPPVKRANWHAPPAPRSKG